MNFGYIADVEDKRDYKYSDLVKCVLGSEKEPQNVDLRSQQSDVDSQVGSSCVGHAVVNALEFLSNKNNKEFADMSSLFCYWIAREADDLHDKDDGSRIRTAIKEAKELGVCGLSFWEESYDNLKSKPSEMAYENALKNQVLSYYRVSGIKEVGQALMSGYPVVVGFDVYDCIAEEKDGIVPMFKDGDKKLGGHAVLIVGIDYDRKLVCFKNSWGRAFGDSGYGWLPFEYFNKNAVRDCWVVTDREYNADVVIVVVPWYKKMWNAICSFFARIFKR